MMRLLNLGRGPVIVFLLLACSFSGCAGGPSPEELSLLDEKRLAAEGAEKKVVKKQAEKRSLEKQLAEKQAEKKALEDKHAAVESALGE